MSEQYIYAVARVRALEGALFSSAEIDRLMACETCEKCLQFLDEKGWGDAGSGLDAEAVLAGEEKKLWETVRELAVSPEVFDVLACPKLFHNLKAVVREVCGGKSKEPVYYEDARTSGGEMAEAVRKKEFDRLPASMRKAAEEAYEALLHTGDAQLCDVIIDRAALEAIERAGREAKEEVIREYAGFLVAAADIKIAVRAAQMEKSADFMIRAMAECGGLNVSRLARAALGGADAVREYLQGTAYAEGADALSRSFSAFERWCDNRILQIIRPQKYRVFGVGPVIAYVIARQNEIRTVRLILAGKKHGLPDALIRERLREMYV